MLFRASKFATANIELTFEMGKKTPLFGQNFKYPLYIIYIYIYIYISLTKLVRGEKLISCVNAHTDN